jgi:hypothetical protein
MLSHASLDSRHLPNQVLMRAKHLPQAHERADDENARADGSLALQNIREHHRTMFGEDYGAYFRFRPRFKVTLCDLKAITAVPSFNVSRSMKSFGEAALVALDGLIQRPRLDVVELGKIAVEHDGDGRAAHK